MSSVVTVRGGPLETTLARRESSVGVAWVGIFLAGAVVAFFTTVGGDTRWLAALGREIVERGSIPDSVPYASAPSAEWENVPALGELVWYGVESALGGRGFLTLHLAAVALGLALLVRSALTSGAGDRGVAVALSLFVVGAFPALTVVRAQTLSLALFPALLLLLRSEARSPSHRVWLIVPILALWSNLHGAVLVGLAVAGAYLVLSRARTQPLIAGLVLAASLLAALATPSLHRTPLYYAGVLDNDAAHRNFGLWARLSLESPVDLALVAATVVLVVAALVSRPALWELAAIAGLAYLAADAERSLVWLAAFAFVPAAGALGRKGRARSPLQLGLAIGTLCVVVVGFAVVRGPLDFGAGGRLVARAIAASKGTPILAEDMLAEQVALAGGRIWLGNPIDAFDHADQSLYFDWIQARPAGDAALERAPRVVLARAGSDAQRRLAGNEALREEARDAQAVLYVKREAPA